jgi:hypothetical protein
MKKFAAIILVGLVACRNNEPVGLTDVTSFPINANEPDWVAYEGVLPTAGGEMHVELSLRKKPLNGHRDYHMFAAEKNRYSTFALTKKSSPGSTPGEPGMTYMTMGRYILEGDTDDVTLKLDNVEKKKNGPFDPSPELRMDNLVFRTTEEGNWLTLVSHDNYKDEGKVYRIPKRQRLFTAEGFYGFDGDQSEFFEKNTGEKWTIAKEGMHEYLKTKYGQHVRDKFEQIYVRGLAFAIIDKDEEGKDKESIVFKSVIRIGTPPDDPAPN